MNLLFYLSRQISTRRILIIASYRPDETATTKSGGDHPIEKIRHEMSRYGVSRDMPLAPFDASWIRGLLQTLLPTYQTNPQFETWLHTASGGNPMFASQFVKSMIEDGWIAADGTVKNAFETVAVPQTIAAMVEERVRRLDEPIRRILRYASVEGEEFTSAMLSKLSRRQTMDVLDELRLAEEIKVIEQVGDVADSSGATTSGYRFTHTVFQRLLYDSLRTEERALLHRICYDELSVRVKTPGAAVTKLMFHAERCGEWWAAADIARNAARERWAKYAEFEAIALLQRGLENISRAQA